MHSYSYIVISYKKVGIGILFTFEMFNKKKKSKKFT